MNTSDPAESLHLITVRESASCEVFATGAKLRVRIAGQSFFTGNEAFKKATEIVSLVTALKSMGLAEDDIHLLSVSTEVESGLLTKTSSATYELLVDCSSVELLGGVLAAIASQKNSKLASISWKYNDLDQTKRDIVQKAVRAAKESARLVAASLSVPLRGVHKLSYSTTGSDHDQRDTELSAYASASKRKARMNYEALARLDLAHTATMTATVTAEFIVDGFVEEAR